MLLFFYIKYPDYGIIIFGILMEQEFMEAKIREAVR